MSVGQPQSGQAVPVVAEQHQQAPQHVVHHYSPSGQSGPYPVGPQAHGAQYQPQAGSVGQYSPSGIVQVVGDNKPYVGGVQGVPHYASVGPVSGSGNVGVAGVGAGEQYGQPEPAGIPPNYKPFGSWGLYIGGNPADGYYSNYYKALSNSVDKQQVAGVEPSVKPGVSSGAGVNQASAFGPIVKQASYPYNSYQDQVYPFDYYTTADLNSAPQGAAGASNGAVVMPSTYSAGSGHMSPVQMGAQVYGSQMGVAGSEQAPQVGPTPYADSSFIAAKKAPTQAGGKQESQVQPSSSNKGFAQKRYGYAYSPVQYGQQQQQAQQQAQQQVYAYPVPVGSQIVGSQPGVEGAFQPYGVHGYTRYAIKPTVVSQGQQAYYGVQSSPQYPVYKQQPQQQQQYPVVYQQQQPQQAPGAAPMGFYGYPMSQLHYSQGSIVPAFQSGSSVGVENQQVGGVVGNSPVVPVHMEVAASEKSETEVHKPHSAPTATATTTEQKHQKQQQKRA